MVVRECGRRWVVGTSIHCEGPRNVGNRNVQTFCKTRAVSVADGMQRLDRGVRLAHPISAEDKAGRLLLLLRVPVGIDLHEHLGESLNRQRGRTLGLILISTSTLQPWTPTSLKFHDSLSIDYRASAQRLISGNWRPGPA